MSVAVICFLMNLLPVKYFLESTAIEPWAVSFKCISGKCKKEAERELQKTKKEKEESKHNMWLLQLVLDSSLQAGSHTVGIASNTRSL